MISPQFCEFGAWFKMRLTLVQRSFLQLLLRLSVLISSLNWTGPVAVIWKACLAVRMMDTNSS